MGHDARIGFIYTLHNINCYSFLEINLDKLFQDHIH